MTKTTDIPNYLFISHIIKPIIDYLLIPNINNDFKYSIDLLNKNKWNEIIKLSIVSKSWFNIISKLISNNIIGDNNLYNWMNYKESLNHIIKTEYDSYEKTKCFRILEINLPFSIIKINNEIITNYFKSECQVIDDNFQFQLQDGNHLKNHKKTIFQINTDELLKNEISLDLLDILSELNDGSDCTNEDDDLEFNLNYINLKSIQEIDKIIKLITNNFKRKNLKINKFNIESVSLENGIDNNILKYLIEKLNIVNIKITQEECLNYSWLFQDCCNNLESIKIKENFIEPIYFSNLNHDSSNKKLNKLSFSFLFHEMIKIIRKDVLLYNECISDSKSFSNPNSIEFDFQIMIEQLSNNKTIKKLSINNLCYMAGGNECLKLKNQECSLHPISLINPTYCTMGNGIYCFNKRKENQIKLNEKAKLIINQGFKSIFELNNSIEYFKISNLEIIDKSFFEGLIKNSKIKTLVLKSIYIDSQKVFEYLISNVLTINTTIKNLIIPNDIILNIFKLLLKYQNQINLYSIKLIVTHNSLNDLLDLISSPITTIKEFNLLFRNTDDDEDNELSKNQFLELLNNKNLNKVINVF